MGGVLIAVLRSRHLLAVAGVCIPRKEEVDHAADRTESCPADRPAPAVVGAVAWHFVSRL